MRFLFVLLLLGGLTGPAAAGVQIDSTDTLSDVSTVTSSTGDLTDVSGTLDGATDDLTGIVDDSVSGSVGDVLSGSISSGDSSPPSADSTSGSDGGSGEATSGASSSTSSSSTSNRGSPRTKFDQLPKRYEMLLERIESGIRVQASIAQLRALLLAASPELRAKILSLIREEIRKLEREGLTGQERMAVSRLRSLLDHVGASVLSPQVSARLEGTSFSWASSDGLRRVPAGSAGVAPHPSDESGSGGDDRARTPLLPLPSPSSPAYWLLVLLAAVSSALYLATRAPRHFLPAAVRGVVEVRTPELWALAVTIGLVAVFGAAVVIDALLL